MSVEEVRAQFEPLITEDYGKVPYEKHDRLLDRLILEVQAAMPCYWEHWYGPDGSGRPACRRIDTDRIMEGVKFCPSCTARAELARQSKPHVPLGTKR